MHCTLTAFRYVSYATVCIRQLERAKRTTVFSGSSQEALLNPSEMQDLLESMDGVGVRSGGMGAMTMGTLKHG